MKLNGWAFPTYSKVLDECKGVGPSMGSKHSHQRRPLSNEIRCSQERQSSH